MDRKTKPLGALGRLEEIAIHIGLILQHEKPVLSQPQMIVFAADHGLARQGVSAYPQEVTAQMVVNMLQGGAAVNVLTRLHDIGLTLVDAGVAYPLPTHPQLRSHPMGAGTQDASMGPAMSPSQCLDAIQRGRDVLRSLPGNVVMLGEMGIGNTSSAALLMARLTGLPLADCVGRGAGIDDAGLSHKRTVLQRALELHPLAVQALDALRCLGGFEIAMMVGALLQAAQERRVILIDGFIVSAALLIASTLCPPVTDYCLYAHQSDEAGHAKLLAHLKASPILSLAMRLGEGSGAAMAWPLVNAAARLMTEMANFESAGVSDRTT